MAIRIIDGNTFKNMVIAGSNSLNKNKQLIDSLNVFPVPDGDTGTNMSLTVLAAAREIEKLNTPNIYDVAKAASNGSLRGARGNSGVIVSQLFRGFAKALADKPLANFDDLAAGFLKAQLTAYKAIMKPKEGTILTIAKAFATKSAEIAGEGKDILKSLEQVYEYAMEVLDKTTDMLPELKQAGVVDAGGKGLLCFCEGALEALRTGNDYTLEIGSGGQVQTSGVSATIDVDIKFAYCTEFFINLEKENEKLEDVLKNYLTTIGDSIVVVCDEKIVKVHVHSNNPGSILEKALTYGPLSNIKIENMKEQHTNIINFSGPPKEVVDTEEKEFGFVV
ncbi:MAG: DAK2 domain-containing protein, partial [Clostridiales bacterium]|nr:DAK2 domain-containing protein [Clostridiales bacterium]